MRDRIYVGFFSLFGLLVLGLGVAGTDPSWLQTLLREPIGPGLARVAGSALGFVGSLLLAAAFVRERRVRLGFVAAVIIGESWSLVAHFANWTSGIETEIAVTAAIHVLVVLGLVTWAIFEIRAGRRSGQASES